MRVYDRPRFGFYLVHRRMQRPFARRLFVPFDGFSAEVDYDDIAFFRIEIRNTRRTDDHEFFSRIENAYIPARPRCEMLRNQTLTEVDDGFALFVIHICHTSAICLFHQ